MTDTPCRSSLLRVQVDAMRRTAALAGAITLLTACSSGDIIVKTDLDERYIVKESAVTKMSFDWKKKIDDQEELINTWEGIVEDTNDGYKKCLSYKTLGKDYCDSSWSEMIEDNKDKLGEKQDDLERLKEFKKQDEINEGIIQTVRYRPIFVDINGDKSALGYASATCLNPKGIGSEDSEKLFEIMDISIDDTEKKRTAKESAYLSVTKEVCDKYAFANTAFFNYTLDDDQDKDKKD